MALSIESLKRIKSDTGYKIGSRVFKRALKGYCKKYRKSHNYDKIQKALKNVLKHIDDRDKDKFDYWMGQLHYETKVNADESIPEIKELRKKQEKAKKRLGEEIDKRKHNGQESE